MQRLGDDERRLGEIAGREDTPQRDLRTAQQLVAEVRDCLDVNYIFILALDQKDQVAQSYATVDLLERLPTRRNVVGLFRFEAAELESPNDEMF
jgi:hypothetical protein